MASIPARHRLIVPSDIEEELSFTSEARSCFVYQQFSKRLQYFLVDYALSSGVSPVVLTDYPSIEYLKNSIEPTDTGNEI